MAEIIATTEPREAYAGDDWKWDRTLPNYPASEYTLSYFLLGPTVYDAGASLPVSANGDTFEIRVTAAKTAPLSAGEYTLVGRVLKDGEYKTVYEAPLRVNGNAATLAATVQKTHAETMYELIVAALEGRIPKDQESFSINGRQVNRIPVRELQKMRGQYAAIIRSERSPSGLPGPVVQVEF